MNITEIIVGDCVLIQPSEHVKEVAKIVDINENNRLVTVKLSNGDFTVIAPAHILKSFGQ